MKVFISWSGERSRALAEILNHWLPSVLQAVRPYYSPDDVGKGTRWSTEIAHELEQSRVGLICLTQDNLSAPWINFEAGSLAKELEESRVCPILFDLDTTDLQGPLVQFQTANFEKSDIKRVVITINEALGDSGLDRQILDNVFEKWWPELESEVSAALDQFQSPNSEQIRSERDLLEEMLELLRYLSQQPRTPTGVTPIPPELYIEVTRSFRNIVITAPPIARYRRELQRFAQRFRKLLVKLPAPVEAIYHLEEISMTLAPPEEEEEIPF